MDYIKIKTAAVSAVTEVYLYDETIAKVVVGHPEIPAELPSIQDAVKQAIVNPTRTKQDRPRTVVYIDDATTNAGGDPLVVPCRIVGGTSARVASFYFASSENTEVKK
ncbi:MAG: hypothetical protein EON84_13275 [Bradyrhizobiaceae bacterium]|nr:MAG: hypothetical protein EON84_13275 [Bradyrhizobiaceae bacterium]